MREDLFNELCASIKQAGEIAKMTTEKYTPTQEEYDWLMLHVPLHRHRYDPVNFYMLYLGDKKHFATPVSEIKQWARDRYVRNPSGYDRDKMGSFWRAIWNCRPVFVPSCSCNTNEAGILLEDLSEILKMFDDDEVS